MDMHISDAEDLSLVFLGIAQDDFAVTLQGRCRIRIDAVGSRNYQAT